MSRHSRKTVARRDRTNLHSEIGDAKRTGERAALSGLAETSDHAAWRSLNSGIAFGECATGGNVSRAARARRCRRATPAAGWATAR